MVAADGHQIEHSVEGRDLVDADVWHLEKIGDIADRRLRQPAIMLLLRSPQDWYDRSLLTPFRVLLDLLHGPRKVLRRELEVARLVGIKTADGHAAFPWVLVC